MIQNNVKFALLIILVIVLIAQKIMSILSNEIKNVNHRSVTKNNNKEMLTQQTNFGINIKI